MVPSQMFYSQVCFFSCLSRLFFLKSVVLRFNYIAVILVWYEGLLVVTVFVYLVVL